MTTRKFGFNPDIAIPPGETLQEFVDSFAMTQVDLAKRTGLTTKTINEIIKGKAPITQETALKLESVFGTPASFWNNLEASYQETRARLQAEKDIADEVGIDPGIVVGRLHHDQKIPWGGFQEMQRKFTD